MLGRLLLENALGLSIRLSVTVSLGNFIQSLICSRPAIRPTPNVSVSKYRGSFSL